MKKLLLISLISFFALSSCKKYEEDEGLQLLSFKNRLCSKKWNWITDRYFVDGIEKDKNMFNFNFRVIRKHGYYYSINTSLSTGGEYGVGYSGIFDQEHGYPFDFSVFSMNGLFSKDQLLFYGVQFDIKSLTDKRLVLEVSSFDGQYSSTERIEMKKDIQK